MTTSPTSDEPTTSLAPVSRELKIYRRRLVTSVIALVVLAVAIFWGWRAADHAAGRYEQRVVREKLEPLGASADYRREHVVQLAFTGPNFRPGALTYLKEFPQLDRLVFINVPLADGDLMKIAPQESIRELVIIQAPISDAGLAHLATCRNLTYLQLTKTAITGAGLKHLSGLVNLRRLDLNQNRIDDASLAQLSRLGQLKQLYLSGTEVSDEGIAELQISLPTTFIKR